MSVQDVLQSIVEKQYLKGLSQKVDRKLVRQIEELYKEIVKTNQHWAIDRPSVFNLAISSLVLASYNVLKQESAEDQWRNVIRYALIERTQEKQRFFMRLFLKLDPNPFARIVKISKTKQI
ncbi:hypothetical protein P9314_03655 [Paenibacillus validus]|uniref:hypothetical protein n=1 Tax=Paenibacillus validus TaxID=44253 RepID=UPI002E202D2D|nr:hypothetical protein [Paenibacillus validus]MED4604667.1 hypothetical protein [Paenibacillus validus]